MQLFLRCVFPFRTACPCFSDARVQLKRFVEAVPFERSAPLSDMLQSSSGLLLSLNCLKPLWINFPQGPVPFECFAALSMMPEPVSRGLLLLLKCSIAFPFKRALSLIARNDLVCFERFGGTKPNCPWSRK